MPEHQRARLLGLPLRIVGTPDLTFNEVLTSYEIRDLIVEVQPGT
ncbi:hypothetical protein HNQ07_003552 [Deinococcus metalli]|uniref:Uncharacterized protein n=1 Tax=Deinococcus metalli TaxID=1141878 RepID=A0A7W8NQM9_9DEIO|nr:hypothetical protein [Deinococcus metalli]MBB5378051.1 hypothetical protein [Deinococcus metalli]GHF54045.1 hypothetical protein GCM10017781_32920 [Deinococcus metalli]